MSIEQNKAEAIMPNGVCVSNVYDAYEEGRKSVLSEQTEQEPEAWILEDKKTGYRRQSAYKPTDLDEETCNVIPLYTAPPKREPLSDEEIYSIGNKYAFHAAVREIERIHGIGRISNLSMSFQRVSTVLILEMRINSIKILESNQPMTPEQKIKELYVGRVVEYHRPHYPDHILYVHIVRFKEMCGWTLGTGVVVNNLGREHTISLEEIKL